jgi:hypothetical protein
MRGSDHRAGERQLRLGGGAAVPIAVLRPGRLAAGRRDVSVALAFAVLVRVTFAMQPIGVRELPAFPR